VVVKTQGDTTLGVYPWKLKMIKTADLANEIGRVNVPYVCTSNVKAAGQIFQTVFENLKSHLYVQILPPRR
jgi:hypothetical protein